MDWEKVKNFIAQYKLYFVVGLVLLVLIIVIWTRKETQKDELIDFNEDKSAAFANKESLDNDENDKEQVKAAAKKQVIDKPQNVTCDISGAVKNQGVYTLKKGARLNELITAAGGLKTNAQIKNVNRALILNDQDKIRIPYKGEKITKKAIVESYSSDSAEPNTAKVASDTSVAENNKVNINTADAAQLQKLNGIGEKKAQQIISYRQKNGQFKAVDELKQVSGIGDKTFAGLKDQLEI
ncbi:helix-hairpin-helix domain-containing protein [Lactobacillus helsingborgensis]|uniref:helix-hairpin-helix domain-containing protein n=1 Tax=Lactobacillus helsingborgensis TaxID=1218494 RepID=UPI002740EC4C|nr:helix-hairpin-helix domain-containing protein [Lactobacillus helsingborgensis]WLT01209.1 helix-hairpin-helix domain-containing protein [Lactobacillus helsingborgensis]